MKFQLVIIFCMYILLLANPYGAENAPDEESKVSNVQLQSVSYHFPRFQ